MADGPLADPSCGGTRGAGRVGVRDVLPIVHGGRTAVAVMTSSGVIRSLEAAQDAAVGHRRMMADDRCLVDGPLSPSSPSPAGGRLA